MGCFRSRVPYIEGVGLLQAYTAKPVSRTAKLYKARGSTWAYCRGTPPSRCRRPPNCVAGLEDVKEGFMAVALQAKRRKWHKGRRLLKWYFVIILAKFLLG